MRTDNIATFLQEHGSGLSFRYLLAWDFIVMLVSLLSMTQALLAKVIPLKKIFLLLHFIKSQWLILSLHFCCIWML